MKCRSLALVLALIYSSYSFSAETIKIGLNRPKTGAYKEQGVAQLGGAVIAVEEINAAGGVLGRQIELVVKNSASKTARTVSNVKAFADEGVKMIFGGSSSSVAIVGGKEAKAHNLLYFGTLTYSNATTGKEGHTHMFRECSNAWMAAKVLANYLNTNYAGKKVFYITADYTWGWSTEESMRQFTNTKNANKHPGVKTPFPNPGLTALKDALKAAEAAQPDVLVLVQFGHDMANALKEATTMGLKDKMAIVVPSLTLGMALDAGPTAMADVIGSLPWYWKVPKQFNYQKGISFVDEYAERFGTYPSTSAASAYSIVYQWKEAVERAKSFNTQKVIKALEGHSYSLLKDQQVWRSFDHQNVQTVYAVKGNSRETVLSGQFKQDYFEIIDSLTGEQAARTFDEWKTVRRAAQKPLQLR